MLGSSRWYRPQCCLVLRLSCAFQSHRLNIDGALIFAAESALPGSPESYFTWTTRGSLSLSVVNVMEQNAPEDISQASLM